MSFGLYPPGPQQGLGGSQSACSFPSHTSFAWNATALDRTRQFDQVDAKALLTCGELGDILVTCNETCKKIQNTIDTGLKPSPLRDLGAVIGFSEYDCAAFLRQSTSIGGSDAGLKFLALASALVTAFDPAESAEVLLLVIKKLIPQRAQHPTVAQLYQIMDSVEGRCNLLGFANEVVQYETKITNLLRQRGYKGDTRGRLATIPPKEVIVKLVELFTQLKLRTGDSGNDTILIHAYSCAPWIAAFVDMCYGETPLVLVVPPDQGKITGWTGLRICIAVKPTDDATRRVQITPNTTKPDPSSWLFSLSSNKYYGGVVNVKRYFQLLFTAFKLDQGQANKAAVEAIPHALYQARYGLTMCFEGCVNRARGGELCETTKNIMEWKSTGNNRTICSNRFEPFPSNADIRKVLQLIKGLENAHMKPPNRIGPVFSLPQVESFLVHQNFEQERAEWQAEISRQPGVGIGPVAIFEEQIAHIVATILAISLFKQAEMIMLNPDTHIWTCPELVPSTIISAIRNTFRRGEGCCDVTEWHRACRILTGQRPNVQEQECSLVDAFTCYRGQVICPAVLDKMSIPGPDESYLTLHWARGDLKVNNKRHQRFVGRDTRSPRYFNDKPQYEPLERFDYNMYPSAAVDYQLLDPRIRGIRQLSLTIRDGTLNYGLYADPCGAIKNLASAERLDRCAHEPNAPLDMRKFSGLKIHICHPTETLPWWNEWARRASEEELSGLRVDKASLEYALYIVPVSGIDSLRLYALSKPVGAHIAVRQNACVSCCIEFCMETGLNILVL
ncbi:hypothetical protein F4779DRAFT_619684 [Xylariaceae sp. FL0662B]|nr:hypothetical protein F4779DRAFT_619684 [Xylariaceae sp. FL0662B]